jgi:hypothetical protein
MITAWEIYWILQLDSIGNALTAIFALLGFVCFGLWLATICMSFANPNAWYSEENKASSQRMLELAPSFKKAAFRLTFFALVPLVVIGTFLPSTRTVAAMIIAPKIINSPTVQHEAGDLYKLAKQALENAVGKTQPEKNP